MSFRPRCLAACVVAASLSSAGLAQTARLVPLGVLDDRAATSYAYGVSSDGRHIVGASLISGQFSFSSQACRWSWPTDGEPTAPAPLPAAQTQTDFGSVALGVSDDGERVVGSIGLVFEFYFGPAYFAHHAMYWWDISSPGAQSDWIPQLLEFSDVSADGRVVTGTTRGVSFEPIPGDPLRWTGPGTDPELLGSLGGQGLAHACSPDGSVIVGEAYNSAAEAVTAFTWDAANGIRQLPGSPVQQFSTAMGMSADGRHIVGGLIADAAVWTEETGLVSIGRHKGSNYAYALDASNDGVVVGYSVTDTDKDRLLDAFIWDSAHGMRTIARMLQDDHGVDTTGWRFEAATAIADDGSTIVGYAQTPAGRTEAFAIRIGGEACRADFNGDGVVNSQDFFAFLAPFFANDPAADFNADGTVNSQDFFDFLGAFFEGCD